MSPKFRSASVAIALFALVGCQKQPAPASPPPPPAPKPVTVDVVKESERSRSFLAVNRHLELGGTLYGYVDIDGDVQKIAGSLQEILQQIGKNQPAVAPFANQDLAAIAAMLGLTDVKAMGVSSVPDGSGFFRNRAFFYTPGDRHGLLLGLGGKPGAFTHLNLAPADTAFYAEADLDLPVVYRTIKDVVTKVAGEETGNRLEGALKKAGEQAAFSVLDLIYGLKGHTAMVVRADPDKTMPVAAFTIPSFSLLICADGIAPAVEPALMKSPVFKRTEVGTAHVYEFAQPLPVPALAPVLVVDGPTLYFATTRGFYDECRNLKSGLAQTPAFQQALAGVGREGNGLTYVDPRIFEALRKIQTLNPNLPPQAQSTMSMVLSKLPKIQRPMVMVRTNLPDGILVQSYWDRSLKQEMAMITLYNPVTVGVVAAMAIPAFQKVRTASQEKAVLNNLRQLELAADQFYLEHGVTSATYDELVGPGKYIRRIQSVMGENYRQLRFEQGQPLRIRLPDGRVIRYPAATREEATPPKTE